MIEEHGRVVAVEAGAVWVETVRRGTCARCSARQGCGHRLLDGERSGSRARLWLPDGGRRLAVGDRLILGIPEGALVRGAVLVYLMPLLLLFAGALLGAWLFPATQDLSAMTGMTGLLLGFAVNRWYSRNHANDGRLQPRILAAVGETGSTTETAAPVSIGTSGAGR